MVINTTPWRRAAPTAALITSLAAIGGCGSTTDLPGVLPITLKNFNDVITKVMVTIQDVIAVGLQGDTTVNSVTGVTATSSTVQYHLMDLSKDALLKVITARQQSAAPSISGVIVTTTVACDKGDISVEQNQAGGDTAYILTFNDCDENSLRITFKGSMTLSNVQISGDPSIPATAASLSASFDLSDVQAIERRSNTTLQGVFDYTLTTADGVTFDQTIHGSKLTITGANDLSILNTFDFALTQDINTSTYSYTAAGSLYSESLGGSVAFTNKSPFTGTKLIADKPDRGVMRIVGRVNTSVQITASSAGHITLAIDTNGDGVTDNTVHSTW